MSPTAVEADLHDPTSRSYRKALRKHIKTTKKRDPQVSQDWTPFRAAEKRYKARFPPPNLDDVLDLAALDDDRELGCWRGNPRAIETEAFDAGSRRGYTVPSIPGLVLLPSFISAPEQRNLVKWALRDHARHPNPTNLDAHYDMPTDGLWNTYLADPESTAPINLLASTFTAPPPSSASPSGPRELVSNPPASPSSLPELLSIPKPAPAPSLTVPPLPASQLLPKLRWANIGWFYHWGTKQYDFTRGKGEIATPVRKLCKDAVASVPWENIFSGVHLDWGAEGEDWKDWNHTYEPDAGIVNFYQTNDTLMAHVDRSEVCATSPLVSISLGCAAIFLIGSATRDDPPTPILLRSGDVVIMSGPRCRRAYHGVPRILDASLPAHLSAPTASENEDEEWLPYARYLRTTRINVNVRQVFPKGFDPSAVLGPCLATLDVQDAHNR
ncbi:hypothetical protein PUNSTDRAFT_144502 [Punctularia strigosozonata HHB-11173 SS5]|uniref:uncharacterized protein n=1 Tax=Punctularia strigosozonata (strain HHB-11173) TaxID=741275 RepID=UPI0004417C54|nr:uncharacterized protein PUNSTDRAFT_144502 [Punctularia strigosozonata HHB-11173 SS5]EIN08054.1 hypothetical protein PUNSTDRAFT_144502 [Punctularia strigosozonata HHB-11173 SS5]